MDEGILNLTPTQTPPMPPAVTAQWGTSGAQDETRVCEEIEIRRKPLSCNYLNGFIYLLGNFKTIVFFLLAKLNFYKYKIFK